MKKGTLGLVLLTVLGNTLSFCRGAKNPSALLRNHNSGATQSDLKGLVEVVDVHVTFFQQLLGRNHKSLSNWCFESGEQVSRQLRSRIEKIKNAKYHSLNRASQSDLIEIIEWLDRQTHIKSISHGWQNHQPVRQKLETLNRFFDARPLLSLFDTSGWLFDTGKKVLNNQLPIQNEMLATMRQFPFQEVTSRLGSITLQTALLTLQKTGSFDALFVCWEALRLLSAGQTDLFDIVFTMEKTSSATTLVTEFSQLTYILYVFFTEHCIESCCELEQNRGLMDYFQSFLPTQQNSAIEIISIYDEVSKLPVDQTLKAISRLVKDFTRLINRLQQNSGMQMHSWLQTKWVAIPLTAGIVMIKVIQYFLPLGNHSYGGYGSYSSNDGGGSNSLHNMLHNKRERKEKIEVRVHPPTKDSLCSNKMIT